MAAFDCSHSRVLEAIGRHGRAHPQKSALSGAGVHMGYSELNDRIEAMAVTLSEHRPVAIGLYMDNVPAWALIDLAAVAALIPLVPIPGFFSPAQIRHLITDSGLELILTDAPGPLLRLLADVDISVSDQEAFTLLGTRVHLLQLEHPFPCTIPEDVAKVTYTSGTTGEPKGVCLSQTAMEAVAESLRKVSRAHSEDRHLCLLPLSTLLENVGGLYTSLLAGATCILPGLTAVGVRGAAELDPERLLQALLLEEASTCILIPQMLLALLSALSAGDTRVLRLRYAAGGGAPVSPQLLRQAAAMGVPVFEGYGLSEAASVVAVNAPGACKVGSVGKPLPHVRLALAGDGEILVAGSLFSGYLGRGRPELRDGFWPTGDLGFLDDEGFLHITGRKKHIFITAFGRNVAPEWVERELTASPCIAQAVVFGDGRPFNVAILTPRGGADTKAIQQAVDAANARLPDYARVRRWLASREAFSIENGQWTATGRPRRKRIWRAYKEEIEAIYEKEN